MATSSNPTSTLTVPNASNATPLQSRLTDEEINGVRLEKALDLGTDVFRDKFHETFPRDPVQLYTELQNRKGEIDRYRFYNSAFLKKIDA